MKNITLLILYLSAVSMFSQEDKSGKKDSALLSKDIKFELKDLHIDSSELMKLEESSKEMTDKFIFISEMMPFFPGGEVELQKYLKKNLKYPKAKLVDDVRIVVEFVVDRDGRIISPQIIESGGEKFDKEVLRVIATMPQWMPGKTGGLKVPMYLTQPIVFEKDNKKAR